MTKRFGIAPLVVIASLAISAIAFAQEAPKPAPPPKPTPIGPVAMFRLPFEVGQGPLLVHNNRDVRYNLDIAALPGVGYGILELNALVSGIYRNNARDCFFCTVDLGTGGRVSVAFASVLDGALSFRAQGELEYLWRVQNARSAAGLGADLSSIFRLGAWFGRDWDGKANYVLFTIALDVMTLGDPVGAILRTGPMEDFGNGGK